MQKFIHDETNGLDYELVGDYYLPLIKPPKSPQIGRFGRMYHQYIRNHKKCFYSGLFLSGKLNEHLESVDREAEDMFEKLIKQFAENEGVTEQLKAENQMEWVRRMNNIKNRVMEIINAELIFV